MTIKELRTKFDELVERHGSNIEDLEIWADSTDVDYKFPIRDCVLNRRGKGDRIIFSES